jgi:hypothetical protein
VPLLYTQETWIQGRSVSPVVILTGLAVALGLNVALSYFVGFRPGRTRRPVEDAVVGMGLSVLPAAVLLVLLDRAGPGTSPENAVGMVALLAIPVSIGFSVGSALAPRGGGVKAEEIQGGSGAVRVGHPGRLARRHAGGDGRAARRRPAGSAAGRMIPPVAPNDVMATLRGWAATLSSPWVEALILGDHLMICEDDELIAAGSILALPAGPAELP